MATNLEQNLKNILEEKSVKIRPENIKAGVNIFGVAGTLASDGKIYASVAAMTSDLANVPEGTYGIIVDTNFQALYQKVNNEWILVGDPTENLESFNELADVLGISSEEYEGLGGTEQEIEAILTEVLEGSSESSETYTTNSLDYTIDSMSIDIPNLTQSNEDYIENNTMYARLLTYKDIDGRETQNGSCDGIIHVDSLYNGVRVELHSFDYEEGYDFEYNEGACTDTVMRYLTNQTQLDAIIGQTPSGEEPEDSGMWEGEGWYQFISNEGEEIYEGKIALTQAFINNFIGTYAYIQEMNTNKPGYSAENVQASIRIVLSVLGITLEEIPGEEE